MELSATAGMIVVVSRAAKLTKNRQGENSGFIAGALRIGRKRLEALPVLLSFKQSVIFQVIGAGK